jgi:hypothetical protein
MFQVSPVTAQGIATDRANAVVSSYFTGEIFEHDAKSSSRNLKVAGLEPDTSVLEFPFWGSQALRNIHSAVFWDQNCAVIHENPRRASNGVARIGYSPESLSRTNCPRRCLSGDKLSPA